ncbi:MAG TPA: ribonuclease HI family protein [Candidatus Peribacterales bacterium]|nr:ribonuclease HI family protein [Candidatus Peribacterales bacterium]
MIHIPSRLEERLKKVFPRAKDREDFVKDAVTQALEGIERTGMDTLPQAVGGTLHLFTDGGSRGNPGESAIGCVLVDPLTGKVLKEHSETIGVQTNNVAEYRALIAGLTLAKNFRPNRLVCHLDSELIVKQLSGAYRVKMQTLQPLLEEIQELQQEFGEVSFSHIPRGENKRADRLVNEALDGLR